MDTLKTLARAACVALLSAAAAGEAPTAPGGAGTLRTGFGWHEACLLHETGAGHPEGPARLHAIRTALNAAGLLDRLQTLEPAAGAEEWIGTVHGSAYTSRLSDACEGGGFFDARDTPVCARSREAAVSAVAAVLGATDAVAESRVRNAFCAVRPPGHHASSQRGGGFCLLNNVAIAARYVQEEHGFAKVLIVDWDVHHGNGTQAVFWEDPTVLYFGLHQEGIYPGTGRKDETGAAEGAGSTVNCPLPAAADDAALARVLRERLLPAAEAFGPDFVLISAGFDGHVDDPLGGTHFTADGYAEATRIVRGLAEAHCEGRLVSVLEGGYDLRALGDCAVAHVSVLMDRRGSDS